MDNSFGCLGHFIELCFFIMIVCLVGLAAVQATAQTLALLGAAGAIYGLVRALVNYCVAFKHNVIDSNRR